MSLHAIIANKGVVTCDKDASIEEIASLMEENDIGAVVIEDNDQPVGMVTDRDIVVRCLSKGESGFDVTAEDIMSTPVECISESAGLYELLDQMSQRRIRRICVTDDNGKCKAVVSLGDLMELLSRELGKLVEASSPRHEKLVREAKSA